MMRNKERADSIRPSKNCRTMVFSNRNRRLAGIMTNMETCEKCWWEASEVSGSKLEKHVEKADIAGDMGYNGNKEKRFWERCRKRCVRDWMLRRRSIPWHIKGSSSGRRPERSLGTCTEVGLRRCAKDTLRSARWSKGARQVRRGQRKEGANMIEDRLQDSYMSKAIRDSSTGARWLWKLIGKKIKNG